MELSMGLTLGGGQGGASAGTRIAASLVAIPETTVGAGFVAATLAMAGDEYVAPAAWSMISDPSGLFEISGNEVVTKAGATFDFEATSSYAIEVQAIDAAPNTYTKAISLTVANVNEVSVTWMVPAALTDDGFKLSVGLNAARNDVQLVVSKNSDLSAPVLQTIFASSITKSFSTAPTSEELIQLEAVGLDADTAYYFGVKSDGAIDARIGRIKTLPASGNSAAFNITVGSCSKADYGTQNNDVYLQIRDVDAPILVHLGDLHYSNQTIVATAAATIRSGIRDWLKLSKVAAMLLGNSTAHGGNLGDLGKALVYIFDDHDVFGGNNSDMSKPNYLTGQPEVIQGVNDIVPHYPFTQPTGTGAYTRGIAQTFNIGDVHFNLPDCRTFKAEDSNNGGAGTMLGNGSVKHGGQTWDGVQALKDDIDASVIAGNALYVFLSSATWTQPAHGGWSDEAVNEQRIISDYITGRDTQSLVIFGDQHAITFSDGKASGENFTTTGDGYLPAVAFSPFNGVNLTPSPLNDYHWNGVIEENHTNPNSFGVVSFDTTGAQPSYSAIAVNGSGTTFLGPVSNADVVSEVQFVSASATTLEGIGNITLTLERDWFGESSGTFTTANATAIAGIDFGTSGDSNQVSGAWSFLPQQRTTTIVIPIIDRDGIEQGNLNFSVALTAISNCSIGTNNVSTVNIQDQDGVPIVTPVVLSSDSSLFEQASGSSVTISNFAPPAGVNRVAIATISLEQPLNAGFDFDLPTWNGEPFRHIGTIVNAYSTGTASAACFILMEADFPASSSDVVFNFNKDLLVNFNDVVPSIVILGGAQQSIPVNFSSSPTQNVNVTTTGANELIINALSVGDNTISTITLTSGQTVITSELQVNDFAGVVASLEKAAAGTQTLSYTHDGPVPKACSIGFSVKGVV